jgi:phage gp45-like
MAPVATNWLANAVRMMVMRGKVTGSALGPRVLLQVKRLFNEPFNAIELMQPYGLVGRPPVGADVVLVQVGALADHKVALGGDVTGSAPADLAAGEAGLSLAAGAQRVMLRTGFTEIVDPVAGKIMVPSLMWSPDGGATFYRLATDTHTHIETGSVTMPPNTAPGMLT